LERGGPDRRRPRQRSRVRQTAEGATESSVASGRIRAVERFPDAEGNSGRARSARTWHDQEQYIRSTRERDIMTQLTFGTVAPTSRRAVAYIIDAAIAGGLGAVLAIV